ncbi:MAG: hypothetical protein U9P80_00005, partial [Thermodesulfobacteriota bacterium]|nr:hypothetical protein [Thermodesulfobacteriota bacterium]
PEILIGQLNFARRIYPYALSNHMAQARLYIVLNEPAKAKGLLAEIIKTDPNADPWLAFSNHLTIVEAKETLDDLRAEAGK